jgi:broad specificity phosphatase PhoE
VREACDELRAACDGDVAVVTHVSPVKAAVAWALGAPDDVTWRLYVAPGSVTTIGLGGGGTVLRGFNEAPSA